MISSIRSLVGLVSIILVISTACTHGGSDATSSGQAKKFKVSKKSIEPGSSVRMGGKPMPMSKGKLSLGKKLPSAALVTTSMQPYKFAANGKVRLINIVPSVDTPVCEEQTHILGESKAINKAIERITISRDLPMAQKRFANAAGLNNITYLSDFKQAKFGQESGLLIQGVGLLARAVLVVDGKGIVRHMQIVPDVSALPDMKKAIEVANGLVKDGK